MMYIQPLNYDIEIPDGIWSVIIDYLQVHQSETSFSLQDAENYECKTYTV